MLNIYSVRSVTGKDSCSVATAWGPCHPPKSCYSPLICLLFKAHPLPFCQSDFTAGSCQIQPQTAMASNNSLVLKGQRSPTEPRFSSPQLCRHTPGENHFSAQLRLKMRTGTLPVSRAARCFTIAIKRQYNAPYNNKKYSTDNAAAQRESPPSFPCL